MLLHERYKWQGWQHFFQPFILSVKGPGADHAMICYEDENSIK